METKETNTAKKIQHKSKAAYWFGANIKILSLKRSFFSIFPQTFRGKIFAFYK
jgi:hypothetical protein